ncbi:MAG: zinc transport system permease protein, partial [Halothiobacillaceae bacterium]
MDDFLLRALLAGIGVALVAGPLGSFVVWRRMAYFGDTLAHAALLGVALGFLLNVNANLGVIIVCVLLALMLVALQQQQRLASDTLLGILSHTTLSLGLIAIAFMETVRIDLISYLFGDILTVTTTDLYWIWGCSLIALAVLIAIWRPLLAITV